MMEAKACVQLIDGAGAFQSIDDFAARTRLMDKGPSGYQIVAIMGPQSSGKSTLMNHCFGTSFVMMDAESGRSQTTKGVWLAVSPKISEPTTLVMDLEGSDGRERGEDDTNFERQSALFALAVADVLLINIWCHDIGREQGSGKPLLKTIFHVNLKLFSPEPTRRKTVLLFVLRDKTKTPLARLIEQMESDLKSMWDSFSKPVQYEGSSITDFFELQFVALSHFEEKHEDFVADTVMLRRRFQPDDDKTLIRSEEGKLPGAAFPLSAMSLWETIHRDDDLNLPAHKVMVAGIRCNEIKEKQMSSLTQSLEWINLAEMARSSSLFRDFGSLATNLIDGCVKGYDLEAMYFDASIRAQKRAELLASIKVEVKPLIQSQSMVLSNMLVAEMHEYISSLISKPFPIPFHSTSSSHKAALMEKYKFEVGRISIEGLTLFLEEEMSSSLDTIIVEYRSKCFKSALDSVEKQLIPSHLSNAVKSLLEACPDSLWQKLYSTARSAMDHIGEALLAMLDGFNVNEAEKAQLLADVSSRVDAKLVSHVKSASESLSTRLNQGFSDHFTLDENKVPRSWSRQDIPLLASNARLRVTTILSQLTVIRKRSPCDALRDAYQTLDSAIAHLVKGPSQPLFEHDKEIDISTMSNWPGAISEDDVLVEPQSILSAWREFINSSNLVVQQATATQEAYKANNRGPPLWAIAAMVVLGWNEFWALVYSPAYLILGFLSFLFLRTLYCELDVEREFQNGSLPAFLSITPRIIPTSRSIMERSFHAMVGFYSHLPDRVKSLQEAMSNDEMSLGKEDSKKDQ